MDTSSPFDKLSGELRNRIYHYFFTSQLASTKSHLDIRQPLARLRTTKTQIRSALALTATNRLLRHETLAIFWSTASFRIVADTLTAYSYPSDSIPDVKPVNRASHINQDRAATLRRWLRRSGILRFAHIVQPLELDLGVWDPRLLARDQQQQQQQQQQPLVLRLVESSVLALTTPLQHLTHCSLNDAATECTLVFRLSLQPSTAMGPIRVPNDRKKALAVVEELYEKRTASFQAKFREGLLTRHGYSVLFNDTASCRVVADLLVGHIVEEKEEEEDDSHDSDGFADTNSKKSPGSKKGKRAGN